ncbi:MAG: U32 family peptidase [Gammaproteobacteria bacterium]|nr:U32 family peptidase [Gammaproteobacteria bacterium]
MPSARKKIDLVCPAGSLPALKTAVDHGADAVYIGFRNETNARNFPGLNFDNEEVRQGIKYAHNKGCKVLLALNTYPQPEHFNRWTQAVRQAALLGIDAVILADPGLMRYATRNFPGLRLHLSVQGSATTRHAIAFYHEQFNIQRVVLPRVLSLKQIKNIVDSSPVEVEVFGFGSLCVMVEGRCALSSYVTGESPNTCGVCSPAKDVRWEETAQGRQSRLNNVLIDRYAKGEAAGYPTLCKGRFKVGESENIFYAMEEPTSLNTLEILPDLITMGVAAIKIEGRQRSPAYVRQVTSVMRAALDCCQNNLNNYKIDKRWISTLDKVSEGRSHTLGAFHRPWQ